MKPRDYDQVREILAENIVRPNTTKNKYRFFKQLEEKIYRSSGLGSVDGLLTQLDLTVTPDVFRQGLSLPQPTSNSGKLPYWEIHHYQGGFTNIFQDVAEKEWFDDKKDNEQHFYFTLRSLITKEYYESLKGLSSIKYDFGIEVIKAGQYDCKIDKRYTGIWENQEEGTINIIVLDDKQDDFEFLKTLVPGDIWNCFAKKGTAPKYKPSQLPQVMFLSYGSTFDALTENIESIVCMDRYTHLGTNEEGILKLKGNTFLNESAIVTPTRYGRKDIELFLGKNTIFGIGCIVSPVSIGDFVVVANGVNIDTDTFLKSNCIITEGTKITAYQDIPAGQKITAKVPLFLNMLNDTKGILLEDFYRLAESRRDHLLKGMLPGFAWWND